MKPYLRADRVGNLIKEELALLLSKQVSDPRIQNASITGINMTRDIKLARIYYHVQGGDKERTDAAKGFKQAKGFIKKKLAARLSLRYMPHLEFFHDEVMEQAHRIEDILKELPPLPVDDDQE